MSSRLKGKVSPNRRNTNNAPITLSLTGRMFFGSQNHCLSFWS